MNAKLRTDRLAMRPPEEADLDDLLAFHDDPLVRRTFGATGREDSLHGGPVIVYAARDSGRVGR